MNLEDAYKRAANLAGAYLDDTAVKAQYLAEEAGLPKGVSQAVETAKDTAKDVAEGGLKIGADVLAALTGLKGGTEADAGAKRSTETRADDFKAGKGKVGRE